MRTLLSKEEVARRGQELYESRIRPQVEAGNLGRFLTVDVETGEYELADDEDGVMAASDRLHARHPDAHLFTLRIGYPAATFIGSIPSQDRLW